MSTAALQAQSSPGSQAQDVNALIEEVYHCTHCAALGLPFLTSAAAKRAYRFPPIIGAMGVAPLLFVGINPRISDPNRHLHDALMADYKTFLAFAGNRFQSKRYIGHRGL